MPATRNMSSALAEGLRHEYETIGRAAGITLQVDCPDLAMGRHVQFTHLSLEEFRKRIGMNIAALNHAVQNIPAEQLRMHLCWGNYPGPHHCDVALGEIADIVWTAKPQTVLIEGANPRHAHEFAFFTDHPLPESKDSLPRNDRTAEPPISNIPNWLRSASGAMPICSG